MPRGSSSSSQGDSSNQSMMGGAGAGNSYNSAGNVMNSPVQHSANQNNAELPHNAINSALQGNSSSGNNNSEAVVQCMAQIMQKYMFPADVMSAIVHAIGQPRTSVTIASVASTILELCDSILSITETTCASVDDVDEDQWDSLNNILVDLFQKLDHQPELNNTYMSTKLFAVFVYLIPLKNLAPRNLMTDARTVADAYYSRYESLRQRYQWENANVSAGMICKVLESEEGIKLWPCLRTIADALRRHSPLELLIHSAIAAGQNNSDSTNAGGKDKNQSKLIKIGSMHVLRNVVELLEMGLGNGPKEHNWAYVRGSMRTIQQCRKLTNGVAPFFITLLGPPLLVSGEDESVPGTSNQGISRHNMFGICYTVSLAPCEFSQLSLMLDSHLENARRVAKDPVIPESVYGAADSFIAVVRQVGQDLCDAMSMVRRETDTYYEFFWMQKYALARFFAAVLSAWNAGARRRTLETDRYTLAGTSEYEKWRTLTTSELQDIIKEIDEECPQKATLICTDIDYIKSKCDIWGPYTIPDDVREFQFSRAVRKQPKSPARKANNGGKNGGGRRRHGGGGSGGAAVGGGDDSDGGDTDRN